MQINNLSYADMMSVQAEKLPDKLAADKLADVGNRAAVALEADAG